jgi:cytochrome c553
MKASLLEPLVRTIVKHPWLTAAVLALAAAFGAAVVVVLGVIPVRASSGHWWITTKLLDFTKLRSVQTYSIGLDVPPLDGTLVLRGAGHYAIGCEPCHGAPGRDLPAVMTGMTPPPPALTGSHVTRWTPAQLFTIVKHGIKFTGMPAWPAQQRDDEVWAVVAFVRELPALDAGGYRTLAEGDGTVPASAPVAVRILCTRCHGADGTGRGTGSFPSLAGQRAAYTYASLRAFKDGTRFSGTMSAVATGLDERTMHEVARYYEGLPARAGASGDGAAIARGERIAREGVPGRDIPACAECHGPAVHPKKPEYPRLASQHAEYLRRQLALLQDRRRGGTANVTLMQAFVGRLRPDDIRDVTAYFSSLRDGSGPQLPGGPR